MQAAGRPAAVAGNLWKLLAMQACRWFLLLMPVLNLFYAENGLSLQDVFVVQAFFSICVILFEVPSGYFSDRLGRRRSLLIGSIAGAVGFGVYAFATALPHFFLAQFLIAIGASFLSGTDTAMLYDTLLQLGREGEFQKVAGRYGSIGNFSEGTAALVGGSLALISLRTPLYGQAVLMFCIIPLAWSLVEPQRTRLQASESSFRSVLRIVRYALHGHAEVKWLILYSSLVGTSTLTIVWFVQPYLVAADLPLVWFGVAWAVLQFSVGFFALIAYRIEAMIGRSSALVSLILLASGGYFALSQVQALWAAPLLLLLYFVRGINGPVLGDYINRCVSSDIRATVLSVKALVGRMRFVALGPTAGWISDAYGLGHAFAFCGAVFFGFGLLFLLFLWRNGVLADQDGNGRTTP